MNNWHLSLALMFAVIALGLSSPLLAQEQEQPAQEQPVQEPPAQDQTVQDPPAQEQAAKELPNKALLASEITDGRKQNAALMRNYSWNTRTKIIIDGEVKSDKIELVRYTPEGELQKAVVSDSAAEAKKPRGIRGRVASKKIKGMKEWATDLAKLLQQYSLPSAGSLLDYLNSATVEKTGNMINLSGEDVVQQGDHMTMLVDAGSKQLKIIEVTTSLDGDAVDVQIISKNLDDGLSYTSRQTVKVPAKKVELIVENYDFRRQ